MEKTPSVHVTLAQSYLVYFVCSIIGLFIDTFVGFGIHLSYANPITLACFVVGTLLILWAQATSRRYSAEQAVGAYFYRGPYRYMRNPTHLGMVFLVTGYTLVSGSIFFFLITIIGYVVSNILFHKYEAILDRTYGKEYKDYQKTVPKIL